ncbi:type II secretion system F family protein [Desulforamulus hydrothermalis]|uniref:Type II secretion system protein n=1 Tax=Desulforamulus hydrothermalis Lam5 = DSM 18033 TaxID=1121428 RepID=K8DWY5_9FIRM|nr:type II secretion system F family protein [Desulforamulus hydrothermalis]CCO07022.1 Type II secretion system protein [Desulforamulus hydrothermalis Lam5 = DSM 18033]SHG97388.1 tight adherence protein C [Desulforamulus hydrothermalis Lam5 = DSM 18033]
MESWLYISIGLVFFAVSFGALVIYTFLFGQRLQMAQRIEQVVGSPAPVPVRELELSVPLYQRAIRPALAGIARLLARIMPAAREVELQKKTVAAGSPGNLNAREWMVIKYLGALGVGFLIWSWAGLTSKSLPQAVFLSGVGILVGWLGPDLYLQARIKQRKTQVEKALPDALDLLTVSVEAGLGFDGALMKVAEKTRGVLADEFAIMLQECHMGKPRREALRDMADRVAVDDLSGFCGSIILADTLGISMGNVLRTQARQMRQKRRQRSEEMAMKAPIKMLFPMVLFIFPAIFVILLGPAVLQIMKAFAN